MLQSHRSIFDPGIAHKNCLTNFVHRSGMVIPLPLYRVQLLGMVIPRTASIVPLPLYRFQHKPQIPQKKMFDKPIKAVYHTSMKLILIILGAYLITYGQSISFVEVVNFSHYQSIDILYLEEDDWSGSLLFLNSDLEWDLLYFNSSTENINP